MKKLLSIILTLALLVSCVAVIPSLTTSAADTATSVLSDDINSEVYTQILDSNKYVGQVNTDISDTALWFEEGWAGGKVNGVATRIYTKNATASNSSGKLLERNKAITSDITDFEWQFEFMGQKYNPSSTTAEYKNEPAYTKAAFCFHVNENSDISSLSALKNVLNVTVYGNAFTHGAAHDQVDNALVINYPRTSDGYMRPLGYDNVDITPDDDSNSTTRVPNLKENGYIKLDDDSNNQEVDISAATTINIKLVGNTLTVTVWNTNNKDNTIRSTTATIYQSAMNLAPSGDFAIVNGGGGTVLSASVADIKDANASNFGVYNMQISRPSLIFDSNKLSDSWLTQNPGNAAQTYSSTTVGDITVADNVYKLPKYAATDEILASALTSDNGTLNLTDFVWETEFAVDNSEANANFAGISFNFHVDKSRTDTASVIPGDSGTGTSTTNRKYMQSATVYGKDITQTQDAADASALVLQSSVTGGSGYVYGASTVDLDKTSTTNDTTDTYRYSRSSVQTSNNLAKNTWYTVRIVLSGNNFYAYIWETANKAGTVRSVYHKLTDAQLASAQSGDFAIVNNYRIVNIKNMRIWDNLDVIRSAEDYSEYTSVLPATTYDFENGLNDVNFGLGELYKDAPSAEDKIITFETVDDGNGGKRLQAGSATDNERTRIDNLDGYSENLADFIFTTELELGKKTSNWSNDQIVFRAHDSNYYALEIRRRARVNATTDSNKYYLNHDYIVLSKKTDEGIITLAEASLSRSYEHGNKYNIKLAAIGNTITVWFAEDDMFVQPVLSYVDTDNAYTTGFMYIFHSTDTIAYYDNINIYDITATELASEIDSATGDNLKRGDDAAIDGLISKYTAMDEVQHTKLATRKTALDAAVAQLAVLEKAGHDVNGSGEIDIRDMVAMRNYLADSAAIENESADPLYDSVLDKNDIIKLRYWVLDLVWSDSATN